MKKLFNLNLSESEKKRILNMHKTVFEIQKNFLHEQALDGQVVQGAKGDPYQYKGEGGKVYYAKKGAQPNWIEQKNPTGIKAIQEKILNVAQPDKSTQVNEPTLSGGTSGETQSQGASSGETQSQGASSGETQSQGASSGTTQSQGASSGTTQPQGASSGETQAQLASRKELRQQRREANKATRQQQRATKEQKQQCNAWFKNLIKFKATMKPEQLKRYQDTLNAKPCCEVIPADQMKAAGLRSCATKPGSSLAPAISGETTQPGSSLAPAISGAPTQPTNIA